jgi:hypothetical protein
VSLRMLTNLWLSDLRLTTAQWRSTGQNLPSDLYMFETRWLILRWWVTLRQKAVADAAGTEVRKLSRDPTE